MWSRLRTWFARRGLKKRQAALEKEWEEQARLDREALAFYFNRRRTLQHARDNAKVVAVFGDLTTQGVLRRLEQEGAENGIRGKRAFW